MDDIFFSKSSLWHPWQDKTGLVSGPMFLRNGGIFTVSGRLIGTIDTLDRVFALLCGGSLSVVCDNLFSSIEFPFSKEMLSHKNCTPFVSKNGKIAALRLRQKGRSGYLLPASTWCALEPRPEIIRSMLWCFEHLGYQGTTPASTSEKVLRSTLPAKLFISKPSYSVSKVFQQHKTGARIDQAKAHLGDYFDTAYEYDMNKAYLFFSRSVPSPYRAPFLLNCSPSLSEVRSFATGYYLCHFVPCRCSIAPVLINGLHPIEPFAKWLWLEEIEDCLAAGYSLISIERGFAYRAMSDFLCKWADILWNAYAAAPDDLTRKMLKAMMIGLPGRFLRAPETYTLIPIQEAIAGVDGKVHVPRRDGESLFCDFAVRGTYDEHAISLTPIGDYIVMAARRHLYAMMREEEKNGNVVLRSYVDCYATQRPTTLGLLGNSPGSMKEIVYKNAWLEENRFLGERDGLVEIKAPGYTGTARLSLLKRYRKEIS